MTIHLVHQFSQNHMSHYRNFVVSECPPVPAHASRAGIPTVRMIDASNNLKGLITPWQKRQIPHPNMQDYA